ncbi:MAG: hypothetical protein E7676_07255 [Ruminococcaceae bacterium]|nr:hypothetical protein [Oscillospiraceae bacterium]
MKKAICSILISILLFSLMSCDRSHLCSLDVLCSNENASLIVEGEKVNSFNFSSNELNQQPLEKYSNIDFTSEENNNSNSKVYRFEISSLAEDTYNLSLKLVDANKYVVDFLRVGIVVDDELKVYKDYDKFEELYQMESDDELLHFNSKSEIFNDLTVDFSAGETKEVVVFIWIEESELYDKNGERYTGWADKSYKASPIVLSLEVE